MRNEEIAIITGSVAPYATHRVDKRLDGYYTIQFMARGGVELFYDEQRYLMEGPWFWPAYPGPHIRFHVAQGYSSWEHRHIAFHGPLVKRWVAEGLFPLTPQPANPEIDYRAIFDRMLAQRRQTDYWGQRRLIHQLEGLLIDLAEARAQPMLQQTWVQELMAYFTHTETDFVPDYQQLAHTYNMSLSNLRRQFKQATGVSLHHYLMQCRITRAKTLLSETDLSIKQVAHQLCYNDVYYFSRQFHDLVGMTPTAYRKGFEIRPSEDS